jgi:polyisoprenoid-binding protein YceI
MKKSFFLLAALSLTVSLSAQKLVSRETYVHFFSETPVEDIEASLKDGVGLINTETKEFVFQVNIQSFTFEKALMQEHFNENYMESTKYPKGLFKGKITGDVNFAKAGAYAVKLAGGMTIHGKEREMTIPATITVTKEGLVVLESTFIVKPADHDVEIPSLVVTKIAKEIEVKVKSTLRAS